MKGNTLAQALLLALGVNPLLLDAHKRPRNFSHTKKGPGRQHLQGKRKEAE